MPPQKRSKDPYDLDAEFGPRVKIGKAVKAPKRRNTTATVFNGDHSYYLAPKYTGPGLSYRRNPLQDVNDRKANTPLKRPKTVEGKKSPKTPRQKMATRRQSVRQLTVERKKSLLTDRRDPKARAVKKPVRYDEEFGPASPVVMASTLKNAGNNDDSGLVCPTDLDVQLQSDLGESFKQWLNDFSRSPSVPEKKAPTSLDEGSRIGDFSRSPPEPKMKDKRSGLDEQAKLWLEINPEPSKSPTDNDSIDSMSIRGGGVSDSDDEAPMQAAVCSTPKPLGNDHVSISHDERRIPATVTSKTLDLKLTQQMVPVQTLASQMVKACDTELKNFWTSFIAREDEIFSSFVDQTQDTLAEITENNRKIKTSEMFLSKLRTEMMAQMETIEMINTKNNVLMSSLEKTVIENVNDQVGHDAFKSMLNRFVDEAHAQYKIEWMRRKVVLAEKANQFIERALNN